MSQFLLAAMDTETTGTDAYHGCRPYMVTACTGTLNYIWQGTVDPSSREVEWARSELNDLAKFVSSCQQLVFHNANFDIRMLASIGVPITPYASRSFINCSVPTRFPEIQDTMVASHIVCSGNRKTGHPHGLKELCLKYLDYDNSDESALQTSIVSKRSYLNLHHKDVQIAKGGHPHFPCLDAAWEQDMWLDIPLCKRYAVRDVERTILLYKLLMHRIHDLKLHSLYTFRMKLLHSLYRMQTVGINIYVDKARRVIKELDLQIPQLAEMIRISSGCKHSINPGSRDDLILLLYHILKLEVLKLTDTGQPATDVKTLDRLEDKYDHIDTVRYLKHWRKATKTRTDIDTYLKWAEVNHKPSTHIKEDVPLFNPSLSSLSHPAPSSIPSPFAPDIFEPNKIHSTAHLTGTKWTRQSFSDPNSQNFNKKLKYLFGPKKGYYWFYCDIVNIELRIWAYEVKSESLMKEFEAGESVHMIIAKALYPDMIASLGVTAFKNTKTYTNCKSGTFARLYGGGAKKVNETYGVPNACSVIDEKVPEVGSYFKELEETMAHNAEVFHYPCIFTTQGYKLDVPVTAPHSVPSARIQGSAGIVIQDMMISIEQSSVYKNPAPSIPPCALIQQVHDSLTIEVPCHDNSDDTNNLLLQELQKIGERHIKTCPLDFEIIECHEDEEPYFPDYLFIPKMYLGYSIEMMMHKHNYLCKATKDKDTYLERYSNSKDDAYQQIIAAIQEFEEVPF